MPPTSNCYNASLYIIVREEIIEWVRNFNWIHIWYHFYCIPIQNQCENLTIGRMRVKEASTASCLLFLNVLLSLSLHVHVCLHSLCCSPGSSFQELLMASLSHCCWQFSTSLSWESLLPIIVFILFFRYPWPVASSHLPLPQVLLNCLPPQQEITRTVWDRRFHD